MKKTFVVSISAGNSPNKYGTSKRESKQQKDLEKNLPTADKDKGDPTSTKTKDDSIRPEKRTKHCIAGVFVLLVMAIIVTVVVLVAMLNDDAAVNALPPRDPSMPVEEYVTKFLFLSYKYSSDASPAVTKAVQWLLEDPRVEDYSAVDLQQRLALALLYFSTNPLYPFEEKDEFILFPSWNRHQRWLDPNEDVCDWFLVDCIDENHDGIVTGLRLQENGLNGTLPTELFWLTSLEYLSLSSNALRGSLPSEIALLSNLKWLRLGHNQLTGSIPMKLEQMSSLLELNLSNNRRSLPIQRKNDEWPYTGSRLDGKTGLKGTIPPGLFFDLTSLTCLSLAGNTLSGTIPNRISQSLKSLSLGYNNLVGRIPSEELAFLTGLTTLQLWPNIALTGTLPAQLQEMDAFDLSEHVEALGYIPTDLFKVLTSMGHCQPPTASSKSPTALKLNIVGGGLKGTLPSQLGLVIKSCPLETLDVSYNELTGTIPSWLGQHSTALMELDLRENWLSGNIPTNLGCLSSSLQYLRLAGNLLTGPIPSQLGLLSAMLNTLVLYPNPLTGAPPKELHQLSMFDYVLSEYVANTTWALGSIPSELEALAPYEISDHLTRLELSRSFLQGSIPSEIGLYTSLTELRLGGNELNSSIPSTLGLLHPLRFLALGYNQLTGPIPSELGKLTGLIFFNLYPNPGLMGSFPLELQQLDPDVFEDLVRQRENPDDAGCMWCN